MSAVRLFAACAVVAASAASPVGAQDSRPTEYPESRPVEFRGPETRPDDPLRALAVRLGESVNAVPPGYAEDFARELLVQLPYEQIRANFAEFRANFGAVLSVEELGRRGDRTGVFRLVFSRKVGIRFDIAVDGDPPQITGIRFSEALPSEDSREKAVWALTLFYGRTGMALGEAGVDGGLKLVDGHAFDQKFAISSAARLYVFGALLEEIAAGRRAWDEVVRLDPKRKSPRGRLHDWADGAPVTVYALASHMMADGDNTATDHLLGLVGRTKVEALLSAMGVADPDKARPFLSTRELYLVKFDPTGALGARWIELDEDGRRKLLDEIADRSTAEATLSSVPRLVNEVGWFTTPEELCKALAWLRAKCASASDATARTILAQNRGLPIDRAHFPDAAYVGGSEPGVLSATWLFSRPNGKWYAFSVVWNESGVAIEERKFMTWAQRYLELCAASL